MKRSGVFLFVFSVLLLTNGIPVRSQNIAQKEENSIRIMSYNIRNGQGTDGTTDLKRIAEIILKASPDVVVLQEVDSITSRSAQTDILKVLAADCLMYPLFGKAIDFEGGGYGIAILSKEKPLAWHFTPLPGREEKRLLLTAEFENFVVCNTHLSLNEEDRNSAAEIIMQEIGGTSKPLFLAGDLNSEPESSTLKALQEKFVTLSNNKQLTFPADEPKRCIDYILGYKNGSQYTVLNRQVMNEPVASDHRPLFTDIRFPAKKEAIFRTRPYLQNPTGEGITVSWLTNVPVHSWVEYGTDGKLDQKAERFVNGQMICNNRQHKIRLENLQPGKSYSYRVCSREIMLYQAYYKEFGETARSETYTFTLPDPDQTDFTAVIFNDIHKNNPLMDLYGEVLKGLEYDLVFFNGDCIDDPKNEAEAVRFLSYMIEKVGAESRPVIYMRGNHEIRNAYSIQLRDLFDYIGDKTYGSFNWGDTRFVMLDCGEDKPDSTWVYYGLNDFTGLREAQVGFLRQELQSSPFKKASKRVLIHHIPVYGTSSRYNPCLELWGDILSEAPFDICLNGHTHRYAYHPKKSAGNNFPVVVGGGNRAEGATVMILQKRGKKMHLQVLDPRGKEKLYLDL